MRRRGGSRSAVAPRAAWALASLALIVLLGSAVWDSVRSGGGSDSSFLEDLALLVVFCAYPVVGALIVQRLGSNPLGWILIGIGVMGGTVFFSMTYAYEGLAAGSDGLPGATLAAWFAAWTWYPTIQLVFPFLLLLYPTGRVPSPRWRPVLWVSAAVLAITSIVPMLQDRLQDEPTYNVENPIGLSAIEDAESMLGPVFLVLALVSVAAAISLIVRFRRSRGEERMQLKWFTFAAGLLVVSIFVEELFDFPGFLFSVGMVGLPIGMGIAILRYRLYEIDLIINRALVYGLLSSSAVLAYLGLVFALQIVLEPVTPDSDLAVAASTLVVAALVGPLRSRIQRFIDRRFYRRKYDAARALTEFGARLRDEVELGVVKRDVLEVIGDTVQPMHVSLWLREARAR